MSKLNPVTLMYKGKEYTVEAEDGIWGLIEAIEDVIPYLELLPDLVSNNLKAAKIYRAFAVALQYVGAGKIDKNTLRSESDYKDLGNYGAQLLAILQMGQPGQGFTSSEARAPEESAEEEKKKAADE